MSLTPANYDYKTSILKINASQAHNFRWFFSDAISSLICHLQTLEDSKVRNLNDFHSTYFYYTISSTSSLMLSFGFFLIVQTFYPLPGEKLLNALPFSHLCFKSVIGAMLF